MKFISKAAKEGYESYTIGLASSENPYKKTLRQHLDWDTGWWIARIQRASDIEHISLDFTKEEDTNDLIDYYYWLDSLDPRIKSILLSLDEQIPVGNWKANEKYIGELEGRLLVAAKDHDDFINMYASVHKKDPKDPVVYNDACKIWNIAATLANHRVERMIHSIINQDSENPKNGNVDNN